jgi:hypothetical protein
LAKKISQELEKLKIVIPDCLGWLNVTHKTIQKISNQKCNLG